MTMMGKSMAVAGLLAALFFSDCSTPRNSTPSDFNTKPSVTSYATPNIQIDYSTPSQPAPQPVYATAACPHPEDNEFEKDKDKEFKRIFEDSVRKEIDGKVYVTHHWKIRVSIKDGKPTEYGVYDSYPSKDRKYYVVKADSAIASSFPHPYSSLTLMLVEKQGENSYSLHDLRNYPGRLYKIKGVEWNSGDATVNLESIKAKAKKIDLKTGNIIEGSVEQFLEEKPHAKRPKK